MALSTGGRRLGDVLVEKQVINAEQLSHATSEAKRTSDTLSHVLITMGFAKEEDIAVALADQLGYPCLRVDNYKIPKDVISVVPESIARQYTLIPFARTENTLTLAMADPLNILAIDDVRMLTGTSIEIIVGLESEIKRAIDKYYGKQEETIRAEVFDDVLKSTMEDGLEVVKDTERPDIAQLKQEADQAPVIRLVNLILVSALEEGASDIHVEPFEKELRVRFRVDGMLKEFKAPPKAVQAALISRFKIMSDLDIAEHRVPQDGRFRIKFRGREIDFRISVLPTYYGEKVVMRILDKSSLTLELDKMGFEDQPMSAIKKAIELPYGMILVTGPTGSGKTTTLYSALHALNSIDRNIVTVEDPVEYELFGINQVQVRSEVGLTFAAGLRSILRQDPDIVMVGEIRDEETADIAVKAALTGHLVLSTLHTNDASGVPTRLIDMGIEPFLVSSSLAMAGAQRLVRKLCPNCKESYKLKGDALRRIQYRGPEPAEFFRGKGCRRCGGSGHKGRLAVIECMEKYEKIEDLILNRAPATEIKKVAIECGMKTLRQNALAKALSGLTSLEEVLRVTAAD